MTGTSHGAISGISTPHAKVPASDTAGGGDKRPEELAGPVDDQAGDDGRDDSGQVCDAILQPAHLPAARGPARI